MKPREIAWVGLAGWTLHIARHNDVNGRQLHKISPSAGTPEPNDSVVQSVFAVASVSVSSCSLFHRTMAADAKHALVTKEKVQRRKLWLFQPKVLIKASHIQQSQSDYEDAVMAE